MVEAPSQKHTIQIHISIHISLRFIPSPLVEALATCCCIESTLIIFLSCLKVLNIPNMSEKIYGHANTQFNRRTLTLRSGFKNYDKGDLEICKLFGLILNPQQSEATITPPTHPMTEYTQKKYCIHREIVLYYSFLLVIYMSYH